MAGNLRLIEVLNLKINWYMKSTAMFSVLEYTTHSSSKLSSLTQFPPCGERNQRSVRYMQT